VLRSNLPDIIPLTQKILKAEDPDKIHALLAKLNG
jgi:phosphotransferase system enzyme I (PtsI)